MNLKFQLTNGNSIIFVACLHESTNCVLSQNLGQVSDPRACYHRPFFQIVDLTTKEIADNIDIIRGVECIFQP